MSHECSVLHQIVVSRKRRKFPFDDTDIPLNGIYILFEKGETGHGGARIVQIGTHNGVNQLRSRLKEHFIQQNKDRSIFRKHIGRCILNEANDSYLTIWNLDFTTSKAKTQNGHLIQREYQYTIEETVSEYIQENFSFCVLEVLDKEERLYLKSRLVSTVSCCKECFPSDQWLGSRSPVEKITQSGLWQVNELYKEPLSIKDIDRLAGIQ